jgi:hypothetical protein
MLGGCGVQRPNCAAMTHLLGTERVITQKNNMLIVLGAEDRASLQTMFCYEYNRA